MNNTLVRMQEISHSHGGKCLSVSYAGQKTELEFECKNGHKWKTQPQCILLGTWCQFCKKENILKEMQEYAKSRGGECLSPEFIASKNKLLWKCKNGHEWESNSAKYNNSWCPYCAKGTFINEEKCRFIFEKLTGFKFKKTRNVLKSNLELDGYCKELNIAFEYQGIQHYVFFEHFHKNQEGFLQRINRDINKRNECNLLKVLLITIPYWINDNDYNLLLFIRKNLEQNNINTLKWSDYYWTEFYKICYNRYTLLSELAAKNNGKLISKIYRGCNYQLEWECQYKHRWVSPPTRIISGKWCPICLKILTLAKLKNPITDIQDLAQQHNSVLISSDYKNNITPIDWKCLCCDNVWSATLNCMKTRLLINRWCLFCRKNQNKKEKVVLKNH